MTGLRVRLLRSRARWRLLHNAFPEEREQQRRHEVGDVEGQDGLPIADILLGERRGNRVRRADVAAGISAPGCPHASRKRPNMRAQKVNIILCTVESGSTTTFSLPLRHKHHPVHGRLRINDNLLSTLEAP